MPNISGTLGGLALEPFTIPFLEKPLENASDVLTLGGETYTDFISQGLEWELNFKRLTEDQYEDLREVYDDQFSSGIYPTFVVSYYSINTQVRMYINEKDIRRDGCEILNVNVRLVRAGVS